MTAVAQSLLGEQLEPGSVATSEAQESCPRLGGHKGPESSHGSVNTGCSLGAAVTHGAVEFTRAGASSVWLISVLTGALPQP